MQQSTAILGCIALALVTGCGASPDSLVKQQINLMNETAEALESDAPKSEMDKLSERGEKLEEKFEALELSKEETREVLERHQPELVEASKRLQNALMGKMMKDLGSSMPRFPTAPTPGMP